jgi:hypothetical protein
LLHDLDKYSHGEATVSGGLLKYWFGSCDGEERNLATCTFSPSCFFSRPFSSLNMLLTHFV